MKDFIKKKRARKVLSVSGTGQSFIFDDTLVREVNKKNEHHKLALVPVPESLKEKCQTNEFVFLSWTIWYAMVMKLKNELKKCVPRSQRHTNGEIIFSLYYGEIGPSPKRFGRRGFILEIQQDWAAQALAEKFGLKPKMVFRHPDPLMMYEEIICKYLLINK